MNAMYEILNFMTGDSLSTHQLPRACDECKPYLIKQLPQLATAEMDIAVAELGKMLKTKRGKAEAEKLVSGWLSKQVAKYGAKFVVKPIPKKAHQFKNPVTELAEMMGGREKVIVVRT